MHQVRLCHPWESSTTSHAHLCEKGRREERREGEEGMGGVSQELNSVHTIGKAMM